MKGVLTRVGAVLFLIALTGTAAWASGSGEASSATKQVKIGFVGPLTGDYANYGKLMTQAIKIAVEERNAAGGIDGHPVTLVAEDSEGKQEKATAAMEKLASVDHVFGLVGAVFSTNSIAIAPRADAEKIVMISPSSTVGGLTNIGPYIFRDVLSDDLQAAVFAKYCYQNLNFRNIAILYTKNDYSQGLKNGFSKAFEAMGGKVVALESGLQGDKDFKTQLTNIKGANPDAIYLPNYVAEIAQILQQAKQLGINAKMLSADGFSNPEILDLAGELANGVVFSGPAEEQAGTANAKKTAFEQKYQTKWNEGPDSFSLNSYDAANILFDAISSAYQKASASNKASLNLSRDAIQQYVAAVKNYQGVSGEITFAPGGDAIKNVGISTVVDKKYSQLGVYTVRDDKLLQVQ